MVPYIIFDTRDFCIYRNAFIFL